MRKQFGCDCGRCRDPRPQANTSVSLISLNDYGETVNHLLFDVGVGVVDNLVASPYFAGHNARLDGILLSHWHPDHTLGLNQMCVSVHLGLKRRGITPPLIPIWCRSTTAAWVQTHHSFEWRTHLSPQLSSECDAPGTVLAPVPTSLPDVCITPVTVSHYSADRCPNEPDVSYACAAFVVQTSVSKAVLLWDIDNQNEWLVAPQTEAEVTAVALLSNADQLFIDTCYWRKKPRRTTHASFENVMRYATALQPRETLLMHLSGHPDGRGNHSWGWTNEQWTAQSGAAWAARGLPGTVRAPNIGDEFELS
jgi:ribonuclease BN (tRNA processing enzyme)